MSINLLIVCMLVALMNAGYAAYHMDSAGGRRLVALSFALIAIALALANTAVMIAATIISTIAAKVTAGVVDVVIKPDETDRNQEHSDHR